MKLSQTSRMFFLCFLGFNVGLQALQQDQLLLDMYTTQQIIKNIHAEIGGHQDEQIDHDVVNEVMLILIGTYEKVVGITVTYCLMMHNPMLQYDLRDEIAKIIAQDAIKIISILIKQCTYFIFNKKMNLKEKLWYCGLIASIIVIIKLGLDQIPLSIQQENSDKNLINLDKESGYVSDKFSIYR